MPIAVDRSALFRRSYRHINHGWGGRLLHMKQPGRVLDPDFLCLVLEVRYVHVYVLGISFKFIHTQNTTKAITGVSRNAPSLLRLPGAPMIEARRATMN